jgi:two-component system response regulator HydG/two-component system response regulator AtoC
MPTAKAVIWTRCADDRNQIAMLLASAGFEVSAHAQIGMTQPEGLQSPDIAIVEWDGKAPDEGMRLARAIRSFSEAAHLIILAVNGSEDLAVEALRLRAEDYIKLPFEFAEVERAVMRCLGRFRRQPGALDGIAGESGAIQGIREYIGKIARTDSNVLITGETGTGKEKVAEAIHRKSRRTSGPFICVNCAAIPDALLESELFGYERGAFTGATGPREGKLKQAHHGTVFFDEIGDMSLGAQTKILRAIESREIYPLGSTRAVALDVRVIAATNRDLCAMMREDRFRSDLYFRLNVGRVHLPPLRDRISDLPLIVESFLPNFNRVFGCRVQSVKGGVLRDLMGYSWPGNIRELRNVIEIMFVHLPDGATTLASLPEQIASALLDTVTPSERERVIAALTATEWNISKAARKLHWSRMTLYRKLAKYDMARARSVTPASKKVTA